MTPMLKRVPAPNTLSGFERELELLLLQIWIALMQTSEQCGGLLSTACTSLHGVEELGLSSQLACLSSHDADELFLLDRAIAVLVSLFDHVLDLFWAESVSVSKVRQEVLELFGVQAATSVPVQELECGLEVLIR